MEKDDPIQEVSTSDVGAPWHWATGLLFQNSACTVHLPRVRRSDIRAILGRDLDPGLLNDLDLLCGGNLAILRELWTAWTSDGSIHFDDSSLAYRWARPLDVRERDGLVMDTITRKLRRRLGDNEELLRSTRRMLGIASLEGRTFHSAVVAEVAEWDEDSLVDLLDDQLATDGTAVLRSWIMV